jgi:hypothetical protein
VRIAFFAPRFIQRPGDERHQFDPTDGQGNLGGQGWASDTVLGSSGHSALLCERIEDLLLRRPIIGQPVALQPFEIQCAGLLAREMSN